MQNDDSEEHRPGCKAALCQIASGSSYPWAHYSIEGVQLDPHTMNLHGQSITTDFVSEFMVLSIQMTWTAILATCGYFIFAIGVAMLVAGVIFIYFGPLTCTNSITIRWLEVKFPAKTVEWRHRLMYSDLDEYLGGERIRNNPPRDPVDVPMAEQFS